MIDPVRVRIKDPGLIKHNGEYTHVGYEKALRGEKAGIWEIVKDNEMIYKDKSMKLSDIKTKTSFSKMALSRKDLFR